MIASSLRIHFALVLLALAALLAPVSAQNGTSPATGAAPTRVVTWTHGLDMCTPLPRAVNTTVTLSSATPSATNATNATSSVVSTATFLSPAVAIASNTPLTSTSISATPSPSVTAHSDAQRAAVGLAAVGVFGALAFVVA